jgi:hypothetical protein
MTGLEKVSRMEAETAEVKVQTMASWTALQMV